MDGQIWSWVLSVVGLAGFFLAGKKVWWCWYVNIANQILWLVYALVTDQYGFIAATVGYTIVFVKNAISWTREHRQNYTWSHTDSNRIGVIDYVEFTKDGMTAHGHFIMEDQSEKCTCSQTGTLPPKHAGYRPQPSCPVHPKNPVTPPKPPGGPGGGSK